ncbi:hypothetical protein NAF17_11590 [Mucilaginibacter sp. RB4R14]|uniref:carboxypeptidase-like regulatory domain-containing protein n=1 Tax=Mucilaginibacter aurantiaciroseus TaxID=2949308 RepID=UPI00209140B8|nr:carboxypeptidase-like regulatory domain-containing protein [Mucilaginibacter aurantiaciroseus]MCO5936180.1 hypothetical protein [Mucilaginibacter aurantiaciroseus]
MLKRILICFMLAVSASCLYSQNKTIHGRVINADLETLPYVSIIINDTVKVGKTDLNGFFQIDIPISVRKISFESVGLDQATVRLIDKCDVVEVVMMLSGTYDFIHLKRVDKLRMKTFKKLPKLHKEAFEKGIFKTDKSCYRQEFIPPYVKDKSNANR